MTDTEAARVAARREIAFGLDLIDDLGEALFHLSDKLRGSGFLQDAANHAEYENVVSAFNAVRAHLETRNEP